MPVFISPVGFEALENQGKGKKKVQLIGHLVLCVAELVNDQPMTIQLSIYDSRPKTVPIGNIVHEAQEIINRSGWLGADHSATSVTYKPHISEPVPQQVGVNTCGLHVIFNAWAVMLGIPIHPGPLRRGRSLKDKNDEIDEDFLSQGLEIVNLALAGFMNSATIQAFFNHFGYSAEQRSGDPARAVVPVDAIGMNQDKFLRKLRRRRLDLQISTATATKRTFSDDDVAWVMNMGVREDKVWEALVAGDGDPEEAVSWYFQWDVPGELPRPEEALSPRTPQRP